jgi:hypothetical protein
LGGNNPFAFSYGDIYLISYLSATDYPFQKKRRRRRKILLILCERIVQNKYKKKNK